MFAVPCCAVLCCAPPSFTRLRPYRFGLQVGSLMLAVAVAVAVVVAELLVGGGSVGQPAGQPATVHEAWPSVRVIWARCARRVDCDG